MREGDAAGTVGRGHEEPCCRRAVERIERLVEALARDAGEEIRVELLAEHGRRLEQPAHRLAERADPCGHELGDAGRQLLCCAGLEQRLEEERIAAGAPHERLGVVRLTESARAAPPSRRP